MPGVSNSRKNPCLSRKRCRTRQSRARGRLGMQRGDLGGSLMIPTRPILMPTPPSPCSNLGKSFLAARCTQVTLARIAGQARCAICGGSTCLPEKRLQPKAPAVPPQQVTSSMEGLSGAGTSTEPTASSSATTVPLPKI